MFQRILNPLHSGPVSLARTSNAGRFRPYWGRIILQIGRVKPSGRRGSVPRVDASNRPCAVSTLRDWTLRIGRTPKQRLLSGRIKPLGLHSNATRVDASNWLSAAATPRDWIH